METIKSGSVIILSLQFLRSFGRFSNAKSAGFWGSVPVPDWGASSAPPYPLTGWEGCPLPGTAPPTVSPPPPQSSRLDPLVTVLSKLHCLGPHTYGVLSVWFKRSQLKITMINVDNTHRIQRSCQFVAGP